MEGSRLTNAANTAEEPARYSKVKGSSWVEDFISYTEDLGSPAIFRRWAAISIVAGALERKVHLRVGKKITYPNMYVILVAPPGIGKTLATSQVHHFLRELEGPRVAPSNTSKASFIDYLNESERRIVTPQGVMDFNAMTVASDELGVLLPAYDGEFMSTLTHLYDSLPYEERKRTAKLNIEIPRPWVNIIAATQPSYLHNFLPEGAFDQGFMSRVVLVYSGERLLQPLWDTIEHDQRRHDKLVASLKGIARLQGAYAATEGYKEAVEYWYRNGCQPEPDHPKLINYLTRRLAHVLRLSMISCAARTSELILDTEDFTNALDWLVEAETFMPDIFKAMKTGGDSKVIEEAWYFVYQAYIKKKEPVLEHRLVLFLQERTPVHNVNTILDTMVRANLLERKFTSGGVGFIPRGKQA